MSFGEDTHAELFADNPLIDIAVRIARVVAKTTKIAFLGCIDEFALAEGHEVKMLDPFLVILPHAAVERPFVDNLSNVFVDELMRSQVLLRPEAMPLLLGLNDGHAGIFLSLESLILTIWTTPTVPHALDLRSTVDAI
jgi:hypothetical protein